MVGAAVPPVAAQSDSAAKLEPVVVTVTRNAERSILRSPFAITIARPDSTRPGQRHASIDEFLAVVPGLSVTSRNNPAQDARLSIRGFGARSAFGVRGVRILRDGMPITLPDGQTPLDYLSVESVGSVEVLRGAASSLYGNASGGVIDLRTIEPAASPFSIDAKQWIGSNANSRSVVTTSGAGQSSYYVADVAHTMSDGSRAHSRQRATSGFAKAGYASGRMNLSMSLLALDNPLSENPGALTLSEMTSNPDQADALSIRRNARKAVEQVQVGFSASARLNRGSVSASVYGGSRSLDNPLTFAIVEIGRHSYGGSLAARGEASTGVLRHSISAGVDLQYQNDLRRNFVTCADTVPLAGVTASCPYAGQERGAVTLDQRERVSSAGFYASDEIPLGARAGLTAAVRADRVRFEVSDRLITATDPNDSGNRTLSAVSPSVGVVFKAATAQSIYANISNAFETPTATELGNHPDGSAGLNPDLNAQRSTTLEAGAKGWIGALHYDASLFTTGVRDELVPYEIPGSNGRRYFRNVGKTGRRGAEAAVDATAGPVNLSVAYTLFRFRFERYSNGSIDYSGNAIPGAPAQRVQAALRLGSTSRFVVVETEAAGRTWLDDANSARAPGYAVAHLRSGVTKTRSPRISLVGGVNNVFDRIYAASIAVNAARGKYYEPASRRTFYAGLSIGGALQ
jgi:iron complex outermembrane receptor protein